MVLVNAWWSFWRSLKRQGRPADWFRAPAARDADPTLERRRKVADVARRCAAEVAYLPAAYIADTLTEMAYLLNVAPARREILSTPFRWDQPQRIPDCSTHLRPEHPFDHTSDPLRPLTYGILERVGSDERREGR